MLSRDVEWGVNVSTGEPWAKLDLDAEGDCSSTSAAGKPVVVLVAGRTVTLAVRGLREGDRLRVVGTLATAEFQTEDGELCHLLELYAESINTI